MTRVRIIPNHELPWAWADLKIDRKPPVIDHRIVWEIETRRKRNFLQACLTCDSRVLGCSELVEGVRRCGIEREFTRGQISWQVAALLIARQDRTVGSWLRRKKRLGAEAHLRRRYRRAMGLMEELERQAAYWTEQWKFAKEPVAAKMLM